MKFQAAVFGRHVSQSTTACLTAMTQGDLFAVTLPHWQIALTTGSLVGALGVGMTFGPLRWIQASRWGVAAIAFVGTVVADILVHPTHFGFPLTEAIATGLGAALLCLLVSYTPVGKIIEKLEAK